MSRQKDLLKTSIMSFLFLLLAVGIFPSAHASVPFATGDVFAGVGAGNVSQFTPTGTLKNTLMTTSGSSEETGMCFDSHSNLFVTNFEASTVSKFDSSGNLISATWASFPGSPESCVVDNAGDIFFGGGGLSSIYEYTDSGTSGTLVKSWPVATQDRGTDWLDLSADQCTMQYTSEGNSILRYNICTSTQLSAFATSLPDSPCYANRIIPGSGGEVLVACTGEAFLLSSTGSVMQTYTIPGEGFLFALNLDPDGTSFWTAGYETGNIYRVDISSGTVLTTFNAPHDFSVAGLAIFNEPTVGCTTCTSTSSTAQGVPQFGSGPGAGATTMLAAAIGILAVAMLARIKRLPVQKVMQ